MSDFNLGTVTAYGYAKDKGYTGTEAEFAELMASYADVAEQAAESATQAAASATTASTKASEAAASATAAASSKTAAETAQSGAETAAQTATTKAGEASASATTASGKATEATTAAGTATTKASEATTAATTATTKAGEASTSATNAAASATRAQEILDSIPADYSQLSDDVEDLKDGLTAVESDVTDLKEDLTDVEDQITTEQEYVFEIGSLYVASGLPAVNNARIRSNSFYAKKGQVFSITTSENLLGLFQYDYDGNFVTCVTSGSFYSTATAPANGIYRIVMKKDDAGSTFTETDIPAVKAKISPNAVEFSLPFINRDNLEKFTEQTNTNIAQMGSEFEGISDHVKTLTTTYDTTDLSASAGYINTSGGISGTSGSSGYYYSTNTVHAYAGDIITLASSTKSFANATVIAKYLSTGSYMPLVLGASNKSTYTYTVQDEGDYAFTLGSGTNTVTLISQPSFDRELQNINNSFFALDSKNYLPLFRKCACLGDSLTRGFNSTYPSGARNRDFGYPWVLARKTQLQVWNYGHSGATPSYLYSDLQNTDFSSFDMAIICLGRNDGIASETDQTAYQNLITKLLSDNEHMSIFICSLPAYMSTITSADVTINGRIRSIAETNNLPYIDIWGDYGGAEYRTGDVHYNAMGYVKMCNAIIKGINSYIENHLSDYLNLWMPSELPTYIDGQVF